jgi:hypothetical protein
VVKTSEASRPSRKAYRTDLSLFPTEWDKLQAEAKKRGVSGREVIEAALSRFCSTLPVPPIAAAEPLPEPTD